MSPESGQREQEMSKTGCTAGFFVCAHSLEPAVCLSILDTWLTAVSPVRGVEIDAVAADLIFFSRRYLRFFTLQIDPAADIG